MRRRTRTCEQCAKKKNQFLFFRLSLMESKTQTVLDLSFPYFIWIDSFLEKMLHLVTITTNDAIRENRSFAYIARADLCFSCKKQLYSQLNTQLNFQTYGSYGSGNVRYCSNCCPTLGDQIKIKKTKFDLSYRIHIQLDAKKLNDCESTFLSLLKNIQMLICSYAFHPRLIYLSGKDTYLVGRSEEELKKFHWFQIFFYPNFWKQTQILRGQAINLLLSILNLFTDDGFPMDLLREFQQQEKMDPRLAVVLHNHIDLCFLFDWKSTYNEEEKLVCEVARLFWFHQNASEIEFKKFLPQIPLRFLYNLTQSASQNDDCICALWWLVDNKYAEKLKIEMKAAEDQKSELSADFLFLQFGWNQTLQYGTLLEKKHTMRQDQIKIELELLLVPRDLIKICVDFYLEKEDELEWLTWFSK